MNNNAYIILLGWQFSNTPQALKDKNLKVQLHPLAPSL